MKKKTVKITGIIILIAALLFFIGMALFSNRISMNPPGTVGNTAGNLNNDGLFCEYNGTVYFSNSFDNGALYSMAPSETELRRLSGAGARNLLAGGNYLYYFQKGASGDPGFGYIRAIRSFNRCTLDGKNVTGLTQDTVVSAQLVDNYLYLLVSEQEGPRFKKLKIDKTEQTELATYEINPACASNGSIYYNGTTENHYLYRLDTATDIPQVIWEGNLWYPVLQGDYIYYMDVEHNYRLCRFSLSKKTSEVLTEDRVDCFNVGHGYIYYQKNGDSPQLMCMRENGSDAFALAQGNYTSINMTSQYVYFQEFGNESTLYHSPLGSGTYDVFTAAREAALTEQGDK